MFKADNQEIVVSWLFRNMEAISRTTYSRKDYKCYIFERVVLGNAGWGEFCGLCGKQVGYTSNPVIQFDF